MTARKSRQGLRSGYTTGACAAAAARAAVISLLRQSTVERVEVELPRGDRASFAVTGCTFDRAEACCSVVKDAGDDPDVTNGAEIRAAVSWRDGPGITITGGKGVGLVTRPGLEIPPGMAAINPVPRRMIERAVGEVTGGAPDGRGIEVVISVPAGEWLAEKTLNPRLGIVGGISILGTTGIVIPYSVNAYTACISQALDVAVACGCRRVVLTTGRRSEKFAQGEMALDAVCFVQAGDFIGFSLKQCARRRLARVTVWGMMGKISKLAAGHLYTNVSDSGIDTGFLAQVAAESGVPPELLEPLREAVTASGVLGMLPAAYAGEFCNRLCRLAAQRCREGAGGELEVECVMSGYDGTVQGRACAG